MTTTPGPVSAKLKKCEEALRTAGLAFPETHEDFPWGHRALKVKKKAFVFMALDGSGLSLSVKLPQSGLVALSLPFASPTGYGLGKSGWVSASFTRADDVPVEMLTRWIEESYRAVAPKTLVKQLDAGPAGAPPAKAAVKTAARETKAAPKKAPARRKPAVRAR